LPLLVEGATPQNVEGDWIANFFDKCRLVSDEEMQVLWSKILAGEANNPGCYSRRTASLMSSMSKPDAELFRSLCSFVWQIGGLVPLIYDYKDKLYNEAGIYFNTLLHLDEMGLISFAPVAGYCREQLPQTFTVSFYGKPFAVEFQRPENNTLPFGMALLSKSGQELARICGSETRPGFEGYVIGQLHAMGIKVTESE